MTTRAAPAGDAPAPAAPRSREGTAAAAPRRLHWTTVIVAVVGVAVTVTLTVGSVVSIHDTEDRLLRSQLRQVAAAVQAVIPAVQQPLVVATHIASSAGIAAFESFAQANVGTGAPFRSVTLWRRTPRGPVLEARVGATPELLERPGAAAAFLGSVPVRPILTVTALSEGHVTGLGLAQRLHGSASSVVYAETTLPTTTKVAFPTGSPFAGLTFALYFGPRPAPSTLMETTIGLPAQPPIARTVVPFGSAQVTILATLVGRPGVLPPAVPWLIAVGGLALTATASTVTERLMRRREAAESVASERTRQYAAQRGIAETLQHSFLPDTGPVVPGLDVAGRYLSGTDDLEVGGDWYDVIRIDDEHLVVAVGDVSGRGLRAATVMGSLRHAIRAYAIQGDDPPTVVRKLDGLVDVGRDGCFATVLVVAADVSSRRIQVASAGHPPALVIGGGEARFVETPPNTPVGVACPGGIASTSLVVAPGASLVVYTDGLVERRDQPLDAGLERLREAVAAGPTSIDDTLSVILDRLAPEHAGDDLAVLGVRFEPAPGGAVRDADTPVPPAWRALDPAQTTTARAFPSTPGSAGAARTFALESVPWLDEDHRDVLALLVSELATNAMLHAGSDFDVTVAAAERTGRVRVGVSDNGTGRPAPQRPWPLAPRGRGLRIVDELSTAWGVEWSDDGAAKTVWFELGADQRVRSHDRVHAGAGASGFTPTSQGHDRPRQWERPTGGTR